MNKEQILAEYNRIWEQGTKLFPSVTIAKPLVEWTTKGTTAGKAYRNGSKVVFNITLAQSNGEVFSNTISHELAHIFQYQLYKNSQPHGDEFKRIHRMLGGNGKTRHNYDVSALPNRHAMKCSCKTHYVSTQMKNKIVSARSSFSCRLCNTKLEIVK